MPAGRGVVTAAGRSCPAPRSPASSGPAAGGSRPARGAVRRPSFGRSFLSWHSSLSFPVNRRNRITSSDLARVRISPSPVPGAVSASAGKSAFGAATGGAAGAAGRAGAGTAVGAASRSREEGRSRGGRAGRCRDGSGSRCRGREGSVPGAARRGDSRSAEGSAGGWPGFAGALPAESPAAPCIRSHRDAVADGRHEG
jgi:hypothetical protein